MWLPYCGQSGIISHNHENTKDHVIGGAHLQVPGSSRGERWDRGLLGARAAGWHWLVPIYTNMRAVYGTHPLLTPTLLGVFTLWEAAEAEARTFSSLPVGSKKLLIREGSRDAGLAAQNTDGVRTHSVQLADMTRKWSF